MRDAEKQRHGGGCGTTRSQATAGGGETPKGDATERGGPRAGGRVAWWMVSGGSKTGGTTRVDRVPREVLLEVPHKVSSGGGGACGTVQAGAGCAPRMRRPPPARRRDRQARSIGPAEGPDGSQKGAGRAPKGRRSHL